MPAPLAIDRDLIKELVLQGFSPSEVEAKTGVKRRTVKTWIARFKWFVTKDVNVNGEEQSEEAKLKAVAERLASLAVRESERILESLAGMRAPGTRGDCKVHAQAVMTAYSAGRKALGLDDGEGGATYRLYIASKPAIDIESTLLTCPSDSGTGGERREWVGGGADTSPVPSPLTTQADQDQGLIEGAGI